MTDMVASVHQQLEMFGREETLRLIAQTGTRRVIKMATAAADVRGEPGEDDYNFLHTGFCLTALPHSKPKSDTDPWERKNGNLCLVVAPGTTRNEDGSRRYVGVPYGTKARLIMIYLQTAGQRGPVVPVGDTMRDWMVNNLGLQSTGGQNGTIGLLKEQLLRIANCTMRLEWTSHFPHGTEVEVTKADVVSGFSLWLSNTSNGRSWPKEVHLSHDFYQGLKDHSVPLDRRAIRSLSGSSLCLDLYSFFAHRLRRVKQPFLLTWRDLMGQCGANMAHTNAFAQRVREALPMVLAVYPDARVDVDASGLVLHNSKPPVAESRRLYVVGGEASKTATNADRTGARAKRATRTG